jgi:Holliday junction resolvase
MKEKKEAYWIKYWEKKLREKGFWVLRNVGSPYVKAGIPDFVFISRGGKFSALEVKTETGKLSSIQKRVLAEIKKAGGNAWVSYGAHLEAFRW